jgi:plastocyanin domain-containing protein
VNMDTLLVILGGIALLVAINWWFFGASRGAPARADASAGIQEFTITVAGGYSPATVAVTAGRPVRLVFDRQERDSCSEEIVIPAFGVKKFLPPFEKTAVEFTPTTPGSYDLSCGMGMLHGRIVVEG